MDYAKKASPLYKKKQAFKVLYHGKYGDCSKIPSRKKVTKKRGKHVFDGAGGISVAGIQTNMAIPNLGITLDAGTNVDRVLERDLIVSHFDGDHVEGIGKAICNAVNDKKPLDIFLPAMDEHEDMKKAIDTFVQNDEKGMVKLHEMKPGDKIKLKGRKKMIEAFKVHHAPESTGFVVWEKNRGGKWKRKLTYTGDIDPSKMDVNIPQIMETENLVIDGTYSGIVLPKMEFFLDLFTNHGSTKEIKEIAMKKNGIRNIAVVHLSPGLRCGGVERDLKRKFDYEDEGVYYLRSCMDGSGVDPVFRMERFKKI